MFVCVCSHLDMCVCVCERERERERESVNVSIIGYEEFSSQNDAFQFIYFVIENENLNYVAIRCERVTPWFSRKKKVLTPERF